MCAVWRRTNKAFRIGSTIRFSVLRDTSYVRKSHFDSHLLFAVAPESTCLFCFEMNGLLYTFDGFVAVYIDGICINNTPAKPIAGYGVFFNYNHPR